MQVEGKLHAQASARAGLPLPLAAGLLGSSRSLLRKEEEQEMNMIYIYDFRFS